MVLKEEEIVLVKWFSLFKNLITMEKFSLKWNDYSSNVQKSFQNLRKEEDFFDITLVGDDCKPVTAHKLVLSTSSEYFKMVFSNNKKHFQSHALICLEGLNQSDLNNVLDYIYNGELQIYQHDLDRFLQISERLKLEGLIGGDQHEDDRKAENILKENFVTPESKMIQSIGENKITRNVKRTTEKSVNVISVQSSEIQNLDELDQKVEESFSKHASGYGYECHYCEKSFKQRCHIKEHVEIHIEGLTFPCKFCDAILRSRNSFRLHIKRQHNSI